MLRFLKFSRILELNIHFMITYYTYIKYIYLYMLILRCRHVFLKYEFECMLGLTK